MSKNDVYYKYRASFRVFGKKVNFEEISDRLGIKPTNTHRRGEKVTKTWLYENDIWILTAAVSRESELEKHLLWLKKKLLPHKKYILELKKRYKVDIFCGYRSNSDQGGLEISPKCLKLFLELDIPFGLSIIIA